MSEQIRVKTFKENDRWQIEVVESNTFEKPGNRLVPGCGFRIKSPGFDSRREAREDLRDFMKAFFPSTKVIGGLR